MSCVGRPLLYLSSLSLTPLISFVSTRSELNMNAGIPILLRTYTSAGAVHEECTVWQAARATSALPNLFEPVLLGRGQRYIDGGLGCSNPTKWVLDEAAALFPGRKVASVISIGTGHPQTISLTNSNMAQTLERIAWDCEATHEAIESHFRYHQSVYRRFSVQQGVQNTDSTQFSEIAVVEAHTNAYILRRATDTQLAEAASDLIAAEGKVPVEHLGMFDRLRSPSHSDFHGSIYSHRARRLELRNCACSSSEGD